MGRWLLRRGTEALVTIVVAGLLLIALIHALPGDPLTAILRDRPVPAETRASLERLWHVGVPLPTAILRQTTDLLHGSLGQSISQNRPVTVVLGEHLGPTLLLGLLTLLLDFTIGMALGVWTAIHPDTRRARIINALAIAGYALPSLAVGMLLVWLFAVQLRWLPPAGMTSTFLASDAGIGTRLLDQLRHLILPLATMVIGTIAVPLRQQRSATLAVTPQPWVLAARARGVAPLAVAWRHCWRPALTPLVTLLGLWLPMLVSGAVVVEKVFAWPGLGTLIADATIDRDLQLVIGAGLLFIVMVQLGSFGADLLYRVVQPARRDG